MRKILSYKITWVIITLIFIILVFVVIPLFNGKVIAYYPVENVNFFEKLSNFIVSILGIILSTLFSLLIYKISKKSNDISMQITNIEKDRDKQNVKEASAFLYFNMISIFENIFKDKISEVNQGDYISKLSLISNYISPDEVEKVYKIFIDYYQLCNDKKNVFQNQRRLLEKHFDNQNMLYYSHLAGTTSISMINFENSIIMKKLYDLFKHGSISNTITNNIIQRIELYKDNKFFYQNDYNKDGVLLKKLVKDKDGNILEECSYNLKGQASGYIKRYKNGVLDFQGNIIENRYYNGKQFYIKLKDKHGYDLYQEESSVKQMMEQHEDLKYQNHLEEQLRENATNITTYCTADWNEGERILNLDDLTETYEE